MTVAAIGYLRIAAQDTSAWMDFGTQVLGLMEAPREDAEGARIVEEGIALRPLDVDIAMLYGYGFPRWRGGPMKYADTVGVDRVLADMEAVAADDPGSWVISPLLRKVAESGEGFGKLNG